MKQILKTVAISIVLLLAFSVSVLAATMPEYYLNVQGQPQKITETLNQLTMTNPTPSEKELEDTANTMSIGNWYWFGSTTDANTGSKVTAANVSIEKPASGTSGEINIVVGPNGTAEAPALIINGGLEIPQGVTVNIYQAANAPGSETQPSLQSCFARIDGNQGQAAAEGEGVVKTAEATPAQVGLTVNGTLNVVSGAICGQGGAAATSGTPGAAAGLEINGKATITGGQLQGNAGTPQANGTYGAGIVINAPGNLNANGGLVYASIPKAESQAQASGVGSTITGLDYLTVDKGTVWSSIPYTSSTNLKNGVWVEVNAQGNFTANAFGTSTFSSGVYANTNFYGSESLTVNSNAILTLPANSKITFGNSSTSGAANQQDGKLTVDENGTLIIPVTTDVTMNSASVLVNNGTIDVQTNSGSTN